jgi:hypothetical protein
MRLLAYTARTHVIHAKHRRDKVITGKQMITGLSSTCISSGIKLLVYSLDVAGTLLGPCDVAFCGRREVEILSGKVEHT